jgi:membrane-bound metal-dependent hydrolase YbcI (DUF457 family)
MPEHFRNQSHTLLGTFSTSLPLGILVWLVFYWLAPSAVFLLPSPHRQAIEPLLKPRLASIPQALGVASGVLIGAWSHVLWDSFTHTRGWMVRHVPLLQTRLFGNGMPAYKALQLFSSVLGLCVLFYAYNKWIRLRGISCGFGENQAGDSVCGSPSRLSAWSLQGSRAARSQQSKICILTTPDITH